MAKTLPIDTQVYVVFTNDTMRHNKRDMFYLKGVIVKELAKSIAVDVDGTTFVLKTDSFSNSFTFYSDTVLQVNGKRVFASKKTYARVEIQTPELDKEYAPFFVDVENTYPNLTSGQIVSVNGANGKVVFSGAGNLAKVPLFLPDGFGSYYTYQLDPITEFKLPDEKELLASVEANYGFGKFFAFNKVEMPDLDVYIVQIDNKGDTNNYIALTSPKDKGLWKKMNNNCFGTYFECLIHTIACINNKEHFSDAATLLLRAE